MGAWWVPVLPTPPCHHAVPTERIRRPVWILVSQRINAPEPAYTRVMDAVLERVAGASATIYLVILFLSLEAETVFRAAVIPSGQQ